MMMPKMQAQQESVKDYYGRVLRANSDLRTSACCATESLPHRIRAIVQQIHPEVREKFYGCGSPIPPALDGTTVLDLGAGSGRDCFILSRLVGANGRVIGVDMTPGQVAGVFIARRVKPPPTRACLAESSRLACSWREHSRRARGWLMGRRLFPSRSDCSLADRAPCADFNRTFSVRSCMSSHRFMTPSLVMRR